LSCLFKATKCEYTFKANDFEELYIEEPIYLEGNMVGKIKSMFFDSSLNTGYGKLSFRREFKVTGNMQFIATKTFLGNPIIQIEKENNFKNGKLSCEKDTITIITSKNKKE